MSRIIIKPIPRKKFDARVNRNMVKGSLPNHYPNTRVGLLENRVKTLEDNPPPTITLDDTVTEGSPNGVKSSGIWAALLALLQSFQNLLGLHVNADNNAHPATAITVDETPVADFTPAVKGNNLQQVTNKVAGLQFTKIVEINLSEDVTQITETFDRNYNELIIYTEFEFKDIDNNPTASRANYTFNNINNPVYNWGIVLDFKFFRTLNAPTNKEVAIIHVKANVNNKFVGTTISGREAMSIYGVGFNSFSSIQISAITPFISNNSKLTIYGK